MLPDIAELSAWRERVDASSIDEVAGLAVGCQSYAACATLLRVAASKVKGRPPDAYAQYAAWAFNDVDSYKAAALRLQQYVLPCMPEYAWQRYAKDHALAAAAVNDGIPLFRDEDADALAHDALLEALCGGDVDTVRRLLSPPRGHALALSRCAATKRTPLHAACERRDDDAAVCAEMLLACGADVCAQDDVGQTPLHRAADVLRVSLAELLAGAVDVVDARGRTPLHLAAAKGSAGMAMVQALLRFGATVDCRDAFGETPLSLASRSDVDLATLLLDALYSKVKKHDETRSMVVRDAMFAAARAKAHKTLAALWGRAGGLTDFFQRKLLEVAVRSRRTTATLLQLGVVPHGRALYLAAQEGDDDICQLLLDKGASPFTSLKFTLASMTDDERVKRLFGARGEDSVFERVPVGDKELAWTPAAVAALRGHVQAVVCCVAASRTLGGETTVSVVTAAVIGGASVGRLFDALHLVPQLSRKELGRAVNAADALGVKPLLLAAALGRSAAVADLIKFGADADAHRVVPRASLVDAEAATAAAETACARAEACVADAERSLCGDDVEARIAAARQRADHVSRLWDEAERVVPDIKAFFEPDEAPPGAETPVRAMLCALGEEETRWWARARRMSRRPSFLQDLVALRSTPARVDPGRFARAARESSSEAAPSLATWLQAVAAGVEADCAPEAKVVDAQRRRDVLSRRADEERAIRDELLASNAGIVCSVGVAAAALAAPGAPLRGDARGPARLVHELAERADCVVIALSAGLDVERRDSDGATALGVACERGYWRLARRLLDDFAAHPDGGRSDALLFAARAAADPEAADVVATLLARGASALHGHASAAVDAALGVSHEAAWLLLCRGASPTKNVDKCAPRRPRRRGSSALFDHYRDNDKPALPPSLARLAQFARSARQDESNDCLIECAVANAPRTTYYQDADGRLRAVDSSHAHFGLRLVADGAELQDGRAVRLAKLARDPRLFWQLRVGRRPPVYTALHAAAAGGATVDECRLVADAWRCRLDAVDSRGRTPLGLAIRAGNKALVIDLLDRLEEQNDEGQEEPSFEALCGAPAVRRLSRLQHELARLEAAEDVDVEDARGEGLTRILSSNLVELQETRPSAADVEQLWRWQDDAVPPLECAERARLALRLVGLDDASGSHDVGATVDSVSLATMDELKAALVETPSKLEQTLLLFKTSADKADALETPPMSEQASKVVPAGVLREVRKYWARRGGAVASSTGQLDKFVHLWRRQPDLVGAVLAAARTCLAWVRRLVAARVQAVAADGGAAASVAKAMLDRRARLATLRAEVSCAKSAAARAARLHKEVTKKRPAAGRSSLDLVRDAAWREVVGATGDYRDQLVDAVVAVLRLGRRHVESSDELLVAMRGLDRRGLADLSPTDVAAAKGLASVLHASNDSTDWSEAARSAAAAAAAWVAAIVRGLDDADDEDRGSDENVLLDAVRTFGDDDRVLAKLLVALGPERCAQLAVRPDDTGACALRIAASPPPSWAPRALTAMLRAGAAPPHDIFDLALRSAPPAAMKAIDDVNVAALRAALNASPPHAMTELLDAAMTKGYMRLVDDLLVTGAVWRPPDEELVDTPTPLHTAAQRGDSAVCVRLVASVARFAGPHAARAALCCGLRRPEVVPTTGRTTKHALLTRVAAAPRDADYPIHLAIIHGHGTLCAFFLQALHDPTSATETTSEGAPPSPPGLAPPRHYRDAAYGATLLHEAARASQPAAATALLRHGGFDANAALEFRGSVATPLDVATARYCAETVAVLLRAGATPTLQHAAIAASRATAVAIVTALMERDDDLDWDHPLRSGETMLHVAARTGNLDLVHLLLTSGGCSVRLRDAHGACPLHSAVAAGQARVTRLLATFCLDYEASATVIARAFQSVLAARDAAWLDTQAHQARLTEGVWF